MRRSRPELDLGPVRALARAAWDKGEALAAAGDLPGGLAWLGRAHRIAPADANLSFALAWLRLRAGDAAGAASLFGDLASRGGGRECLAGLAAARLQTGPIDAAVAAMVALLSAHAVDGGSAALARRVAQAAGARGWCGLREDGAVLAEAGDAALVVMLDGVAVRVAAAADGTRMLPECGRTAATLRVLAEGADLLGSPVSLWAIRRVEGFVARTAEGVEGWAWHPASPGIDPVLRLVVAGVPDRSLTARDALESVDGAVPLARPRGFRWPVPAGCTARVLGGDGRDLLGSPAAVPPERFVAPAAPVAARGALTSLAALPVDVVIPVYRGVRTTLDCLDSVIATVRPPHRIRVVDDGAPEPELVAALKWLAERGEVELIRTEDGRRGFPAAVNAGMRAAEGRHVVLLNSDTLVAPGWLERLRAAGCAAADYGTATPLSNEASIFSTPDPAGGNPAPDLAATRALAALAAQANGARVVEVPTAHGFCMFIRRDCLDATGLFDESLFAQGYGEENDFTERARALGWRHVAVPGVYVAHHGGVSFGAARGHLLQRNLGLLELRHPGYRARVADFLARDPLFPARRRLDAARWRALLAGSTGAVLLVTHGGGGGTARIVAERAASVRARGLHPIVLRAVDGRCEVGSEVSDTPNLAFALPRELAALARLLAAAAPVEAELHHLLGHDHSVLRLFASLGIPYDIWVHDYGWFCARLSFVTGDGHFCGEAETAICDECVARWGRSIEDPVAPAALRRRSEADFRGARAVIVPAGDVARRVLRHAPGVAPAVRPWEADPPFAPPRIAWQGGQLMVAVVGAIGIDKGFDVLLACARDAAARALDLFFTVVGYTVDDAALLETGRAFVTGEFGRGEAAGLIRAQAAHLAFLPSIWPETWCYALSDMWDAGLAVAAFDIGTPAERIRRGGRGWLLPLGLPAPAVNDMLLAIARRSSA